MSFNPLRLQITREWFPMKESAAASGGITLSMVLGTCIALSIPPLFVSTAKDIPTLNIVWFIPLAIIFIMAITFVRSDQPPTPPSRSAEQYANEPKTAYLKKYKNWKNKMKCIKTEESNLCSILQGITTTCAQIMFSIKNLVEKDIDQCNERNYDEYFWKYTRWFMWKNGCKMSSCF